MNDDFEDEDGPSMDHKLVVRLQGELPYQKRAQPYADMDEAVMDEQPLMGLVMSYGLDAPDMIPAGGMTFYKVRPIALKAARE